MSDVTIPGDAWAQMLTEIRAGREENSARFDALDRRLAMLETRMGELEKGLRGLTRRFDEHVLDLSHVRGDQRELRERVEALEAA